ncbi:MAG TPA: hypothetical protein PLQ88_15100, partial [Blastocatellia bacterium]|nr:hypothetical protein [Blastocatellia bacterium]
MSNKISRPPSAPRKADDFRIINGLPKTAKAKLHTAGILTFTQLAAMSAHEIAAAVGEETEITAERILREDWIGQAEKLAASNKEEREPVAPPVSHKPNETRTSFALELKLNEDRTVKQTRVMHVESEEKDAEEIWPGWDETHLLSFFAQRGKIAFPLKHEVKEPAAAPAVSVEERLNRLFARSGVNASLISAQPPSPSADNLPSTSGAPRSKKLEVFAPGSEASSGSTPSGQPYCVRVSLDSKPAAKQLTYNVTVYAKSLSPAAEATQRLVIGESEGVLAATDNLACAIEGAKLSQGAYRLSAAVRFKTVNSESDSPRQFTTL